MDTSHFLRCFLCYKAEVSDQQELGYPFGAYKSTKIIYIATKNNREIKKIKAKIQNSSSKFQILSFQYLKFVLYHFSLLNFNYTQFNPQFNIHQIVPLTYTKHAVLHFNYFKFVFWILEKKKRKFKKNNFFLKPKPKTVSPFPPVKNSTKEQNLKPKSSYIYIYIYILSLIMINQNN